MRVAVENIELCRDQVDVDHSTMMLGSPSHRLDDEYALPIESSTNNAQLRSLTLHFRRARQQLREQLANDAHARRALFARRWQLEHRACARLYSKQ